MAEQHQHSEGTERVREAVRDGFTIMLGAASWAFELGDRMVETWLHQGETSREEGRRRFEEFKSNTRRRGEDLSRRVSESVRSTVPIATRDQVASLERQVAELTRQLHEMQAGGGASASGSTPTRDRPPQA